MSVDRVTGTTLLRCCLKEAYRRHAAKRNNKVTDEGHIPLLYSSPRPGRIEVRAISTCRDSSKLSATCFRPKKSRKLIANQHELVKSQVGNQVCDEVCDLDSVMEFGLETTTQERSYAAVDRRLTAIGLFSGL